MSKIYVLWVNCHRNDVLLDCGQHDQGDYSSDAVAIRELMQSARWLLNQFGRVDVTITKDGETIHNTTLYRPAASAFGSVDMIIQEMLQ